jgi:hypothetical protein
MDIQTIDKSFKICRSNFSPICLKVAQRLNIDGKRNFVDSNCIHCQKIKNKRYYDIHRETMIVQSISARHKRNEKTKTKEKTNETCIINAPEILENKNENLI